MFECCFNYVKKEVKKFYFYENNLKKNIFLIKYFENKKQKCKKKK